ncbi:MAG: RNA polymerase sigma factor [Gammaproteobacteria bacterium]|nr:RNA polymerase sigma factor [Gammaproteobacteria bacterium]
MKIFDFSCKSRISIHQLKNCRERLYRLAYSWCHDTMLADDLAQETLSKAMQKIDQLKNENLLDAWLFAILNNQWREYLRRTRPCEDIDELVYMHDQTPEYWHDRQQMVDQVQLAISELGLGQRQVITLIDIEGLSYLQVSETLEIPVGTVMSRLNRARTALQKKLQKRQKLSSTTLLRSVK